MVRAALYIRVSTEEQAIHGLSIDAQKEALIKYAKENNMEIICIYVDEGISARKKYQKREDFMKLLGDIQVGKIDVILFTKLDRWFRNISDYYKVQEILEQHNVNWKTIFENYDTSTASGRLHINIMLSVAQDEADRTSERIKSVFKHKLDNGEWLNASVPYGFKLINKKLLVDEEKAPRVRETFNTYELKRSKCATQKWYIETYQEKVSYEFISKMLTREIYIGKKGNNLQFCEAIISKEQFDRINKTSNTSFAHLGKTGLTYIFSGLTLCHTCKRKMNGIVCYNPKPKKYYGCRHGMHFTTCTHNRRCREDRIEEKALLELELYINTKINSIQTTTLKPKTQKSKQEVIIKKLKKLKELYVEDLIQIEDYRKDYDSYIKQLEAIEAEETQSTASSSVIDVVKFVNDCNYKELYRKMDDEHKRLFWYKIINIISITDKNEIHIDFKV